MVIVFFFAGTGLCQGEIFICCWPFALGYSCFFSLTKNFRYLFSFFYKSFFCFRFFISAIFHPFRMCTVRYHVFHVSCFSYTSGVIGTTPRTTHHLDDQTLRRRSHRPVTLGLQDEGFLRPISVPLSESAALLALGCFPTPQVAVTHRERKFSTPGGPGPYLLPAKQAKGSAQGEV